MAYDLSAPRKRLPLVLPGGLAAVLFVTGVAVAVGRQGEASHPSPVAATSGTTAPPTAPPSAAATSVPATTATTVAPSALARILAAGSKTTAAKSSRAAIQVSMTGLPGVPGGLTITGAGMFDYANARGSVTMTVPPIGGQPVGTIELIVTGTTFYVKLPPTISGRSGGKPWVKLDLTALGQRSGLDLSSLAQLQSGDPGQALKLLDGASNVTALGTETVRGVPATHYKVTITAPATFPGAFGGQQLASDVWTDEQGRLRKLTYGAGGINFSLELFDFGVPVQVSPPAAADVTDVAPMLGPLK